MAAALSLQLAISQPLFTARLEQKQLRYFVQRPTEEAVKKHQRDSQGRALKPMQIPKFRSRWTRLLMEAAMKRRFAAHRISYAYHNGIDPKELCVCHSCDNPACINPDHLFLGTHKDNTADMLAKGRQAKMAGERNPRAQITRDTVERVVADIVAGKSNREIADQLPIGHAQVSLIRLGKSWKNVLKELGYEPDKHRRFSRAS